MVDHNRQARIADFGLLRVISDKANFISSITYAGGGTLRWMAPELLDPKSSKPEDTRPTKQSDIYALGMVVYEVLSGQKPFPGYMDITVMQKVIRDERPQRPQGARGVWFNNDIWEMLELCWRAERDDRPSLETLLQCLEGATQPSRSPSPAPTTNEDVEAIVESREEPNQEFIDTVDRVFSSLLQDLCARLMWIPDAVSQCVWSRSAPVA